MIGWRDRASRAARVSLLLAALMTAVAAAPGLTETQFRGDLGVDLSNYGFTVSLLDTNRAHHVTRVLSNHYLDGILSGSLVSPQFASYSLRGRLYGTYFRSSIDTAESDAYLNPDLHTYGLQLTFFPNRRYPLKLYHSRTREFSLRYEPTNRTDVEVLQPQLAVVRRYDNIRRTTGGQMQVAFNPATSLLAELRSERIKTLRAYDFGENRDIWVTFTTTLYDPLRSRDTVTVINDLPDADLAVIIDDLSRATVPVGERVTIPVDSGSHDVQLVPLRYYNQYAFRIVIRGNMFWRVVYKEPASPRDQDQTSDGGTMSFRYDADGRFTNETFFDYTDQWESVQRVQTRAANFANTARYDMSERSQFTSLTTYTDNRSDVDTVSFQRTQTLLQTSTYRYARRAGFNSTISHSYNRSITTTNVDRVVSNMNQFSGRLRSPRRWLRHRLDLRGDIALLSDSRGYVNNQYTITVGNRLGLRWGRMDLEPRHELKFTRSNQQNPHQSSDEIDTRIGVRGDMSRHPLLGNLSFRLEYNYRNKYDDVGSDIRNRYIFDLAIIKKLSSHYRLILLTTQELEMYGGTAPTAGTGTDGATRQRPNLHKASYKVGAQLNPAEGLTLDVGFMVVSQNGTHINRFNASLAAVVPWLDLPIRSFVTSERRDVTGLPSQSNLLSETKLSYRFRDITFVLTHTYSREVLITQSFSFYELRMEVSRRFSMF